MSEGTKIAPTGYIYQCMACGRKSHTRYGIIDNGTPSGGDYLPDGTRVSQYGYDESCMLNSELVKSDREHSFR